MLHLLEIKSTFVATITTLMKIDGPYNIRLGKLKGELEKIAFEKDMKLPELIKAVLRGYIRKQKAKQNIS